MSRRSRTSGSRGAHAAPRTTALGLPAIGTARPRHGRLIPAPLTGLMLGAVGGGLALLGVITPAPVPDRVDRSSTGELVMANGAVQPSPLDSGRDERASRSRRAAAPEPEPSPVDDAAAVVTMPPAPPAPPPPAEPLPGCDGKPHDLSGYRNGGLPGDVLCEIPGAGERLRADAAVAFARLASAYQAARGTPLCLTDGYRPLAEQQQLRRSKPRFAARPGYSNHGWGVAVDLSCGVQSSRTAAHAWMTANANSFGWFLPEWAQPGSSRPEPWHWEFAAEGAS